jgi:site-specific recombinase XerD
MKLPTYRPVWNYRNAVNKNGRYMIHIEIYISRQVKREYEEVEVPLKVAKDEWCGKPGSWVKINHPYAFEINEAIREKLALLTDLNKRYYAAKKSLTWPLIKKELQRNNNTNSFLAYFREVIRDPPETLDDSTIDRYKVTLKHLTLWRPDMTFNDLSEELFREFKKYLEQQKDLAGSTINGYFNACKKVVDWARKDNHISKEHEDSIFEDIHFSIGKPKKDRLELDEITAWKNHEFGDREATQERDRDLFLIQIYTGYYYNDLRELLKSEFKKDPEFGPYFQRARYKNDNQAIVPIWKFKNAAVLIEKYRSKDYKDPYFFRRDIFTEDQPYNRNLKRIARRLGWQKNVYNKMGRNTNAQLCIRFGGKRPVVSRMLGHEKEETTSSYYEVNVADVIEGTRDINFDKFDI